MRTNVARKVSEINLKSGEYLSPLYEVVVNAIHAIEDKNEPNGLIEVEVIRDESQKELEGEGFERIHPIKSFLVRDNGIGFNDAEMDAFDEAYTDHKLKKGGKGVGRFTVLSAFEQMKVSSNFLENEEMKEREFIFSTKYKGGISHTKEKRKSQSNQTGSEILLNRYKKFYLNPSSVDLNTLCDEMVSNLLIFFLSDNMPTVKITDLGETRNLQDHFNIYINGNRTVDVSIAEKPFKFYFLKHLVKSSSKLHKIHFCAHNRNVKSINIKSFIPNLYNPIERNNEKYYLSVFITGKYLDDNLNEVRNTFTFPDESDEKDEYLIKDVSLEDIKEKVKEEIKKEYKGIIDTVDKNKLEKIKEYILSRQGIEYRHLADQDKALENIPPEDLSPEKLDSELHKINYELEKRQSKRMSKVLERSADDNEVYQQELLKVLAEENKFSQAKLINYVVHRNTILKVFGKYLNYQDKKGNYKKEKDLHNIIFPMGGDNDTLPFSKHNLWLLDERLAFHTYTASDKKMKDLKPLDSEYQKKPDLLIFDKRFLFSSDEEHSSLIMFEFKKPDKRIRDKVDQQVIDYFKKLMTGNVKNYKGRLIEIDKTTPKFGYIICQLSKKLRDELISFHKYRKTPYNSVYTHHDEINLYLEIIDFHQVHKNSNERHTAFFRKLGIKD